MGQGQSLVWTFPNSSVPMFIQSRQHNPKGFSLDPPHVAWLLSSRGTILNSRNSFITNIINMQTTVAFSAPVARPATGTSPSCCLLCCHILSILTDLAPLSDDLTHRRFLMDIYINLMGSYGSLCVDCVKPPRLAIR